LDKFDFYRNNPIHGSYFEISWVHMGSGGLGDVSADAARINIEKCTKERLFIMKTETTYPTDARQMFVEEHNRLGLFETNNLIGDTSMYTQLKIEMDNLFSRNNLGEFCLRNPQAADMWKTDEQNYTTIRVPKNKRDRFSSFWKNVEYVLGEDLKVLHVQEGTPLSEDFFINETWYFIPTKTAMQIFRQFDTILSASLPGMRYN